jgi:hypothetical protein
MSWAAYIVEIEMREPRTTCEIPRLVAFVEVLLRIAPPFRTVPLPAGQRVVEAIDKHASLCFLDGHCHPLPHKPQWTLLAARSEMVVDEAPPSCFTGTCLRNGGEELLESWSKLAVLAKRQRLHPPSS